MHGKQNTQYKPEVSQLPPSASNRKSGLRSTGRSSAGNGSEVQEVVERLGLAKDGEALGPKKNTFTRNQLVLHQLILNSDFPLVLEKQDFYQAIFA